MTKERFIGCPGLVAEELLGMIRAIYIAGARGIFELINFDLAKPGILKRLGPVSNDGVDGLATGVSSKVCTRALRSRGEDSGQFTVSRRQ